MKHSISKRPRIVLFILIPILVSLACQMGTQSPTADPQETDDPATDSQDSDVLIIEADVVFGPGPFNFPDTEAGLADLSSYKATLSYSFEGTRDGQIEQWSKTYILSSAKEPTTLQLTIEKTGDLIGLNPIFMAEVNGAEYERRGESTCTANMSEAGNSLRDRMELAGFLNFVIGADEAGAETVNEVAANHYTFDERAFGQLGLAQSTGEMWVAMEGGFIVRYLLTTQGNADYFGEGIEGILTLDYELTDVNQPITITLPDDCPAGMVNAPLLPDAANLLSVPSVMSYDTSSSLADAAAFYQEQIPNLGWTLNGVPAITETNALMEFTQGDQILTVIITTDAGVSTVTILLEKAQE